MNYDNLPIYKSALDFCVYIETIVRGFDKYNKYSIGEDLRTYFKEILFLIHRANCEREKESTLLRLVRKCEESKMLIQIANIFVVLGSDSSLMFDFRRYKEEIRL